MAYCGFHNRTITGISVAKKYRIVVDQNMPGIDELFADFSEIICLEGRSINNQVLLDADALLCRSITRVDQALLQNSKVKFVGTATIGTDHLDIDWLESHQINWANAAGCNAAAVAQYILSGMAFWSRWKKRDIKKLNIGIVGAGNVGTELARCLDLLGIHYLLCDPPLESQGDKRPLVSFEEALKCDVISLHVPITDRGRYPTRHLINQASLAQIKQSQLLINASRGAVVDNQALADYLLDSKSAAIILDVFENEPHLPLELIEKCLLATPHIAGHTLEGKLRGSWLIFKSFCKAFDILTTRKETDLYPPANQISLNNADLGESLLALYDIQSDSQALRVATDPIAKRFDQLRKNASQLTDGTIRRDYSGWQFLGDFRLPL